MATLTDPTGRGRKARTITATDPATGATLTRSTDRIYWAAVVFTASSGKVTAAAWAGRPDLAAKALAQRGGAANGYRLAPVTGDPWAAPGPAAPAAPVAPDPTPEPTPDPLAAAAAELVAALAGGPALEPLNPAGGAFETEALARAAADLITATGQMMAAPYLAGPGHLGRPEPLGPEPTATAARVTLPGEPPAPAPVAPAGPQPTLPTLRAAAAAGRPVSLAALSRTLGRELGLATGGRRPARPGYQPADPLEGLPWDPGTPAARARHADQGRRAAILWPVAQAITGAGHRLPPSWASDGPVLNGEVGPVTALAALPAALLESAAAALAALPPVTPAQAQALELVRDALAR